MSANKSLRKNRYKAQKPGKKASAKRLMGLWLKAGGFTLAFCLTGVLFVFGYDALTQCEYFEAGAITIKGSGRLSEKTILEAAELEYGENILSVNLAMVRKRLVAEPWIKAADVRREFPSRLIIRVQEQKPMAVLDVGRCFLINDSGEIFKEADAPEICGLPIIAGIDYADWRSPRNPETKIYKAIMALLQELEKQRRIFPVSAIYEISADHEMGLTLRTSGPVETVHLGYGNYKKKLQRVAVVIAEIQTDERMPEIQTLDAYNPARIIATPTAHSAIDEEKEV